MSKYGKCKSLIESVDGPADCAARAEKGYCPKRMWRGKESKYKVTATCWKVQDRDDEKKEPEPIKQEPQAPPTVPTIEQ